MKRLLSSNKGMTLIEVLLTLTIAAIVSAVLYSVFITGLKLYQKVGIEGNLRDEADFSVTMILNELYNKPPHYVVDYENPHTGAQGIKLVRYEDKIIDDYVIEDSTIIDQTLLIYFENESFYLEWVDENNNTEKKEQISNNRIAFTSVNVEDVLETSSISINSCSQQDLTGKCQHGTISLNIVITDETANSNPLINTEPLILKSTFGF